MDVGIPTWSPYYQGNDVDSIRRNVTVKVKGNRMGNFLIPPAYRELSQEELRGQLDQLEGKGQFAGEAPLGVFMNSKELALRHRGYTGGPPSWSPYFDSRKNQPTSKGGATKSPGPAIDWKATLEDARVETEKALVRKRAPKRRISNSGNRGPRPASRSHGKSSQHQRSVSGSSNSASHSTLPRYMQPIVRKPPVMEEVPKRKPQPAKFYGRMALEGTSSSPNQHVPAKQAPRPHARTENTPTFQERRRNMKKDYVRQRKALDAM